MWNLAYIVLTPPKCPVYTLYWQELLVSGLLVNRSTVSSSPLSLEEMNLKSQR